MLPRKNISIVFPFRSFHNQKFNIAAFLFFLLPPIFNAIVLSSLNQIMQAWGIILQYGLSKLASTGTIIYTQYSVFHTTFFLPSIVLEATPPTPGIFWISIAITTTVFFFSFFIKNSYLPLKYILRAALILVWSTHLYFYFSPANFPYDISVYTKSGFLQILALLLATPCIYCFTYYIYGYRILSKIALTALVLNYLIILTPFQYLLNAILIHQFSLILMPVLYFFAGLLINIFSIIAFYAYGISMEHHYPKYKK